MPEQWIPKAGLLEKECSKQQFERWWKHNHTIWFEFDNWSEGDQEFIKKIAFAAWEHQRETATRLIIDIFETIKETK